MLFGMMRGWDGVTRKNIGRKVRVLVVLAVASRWAHNLRKGKRADDPLSTLKSEKGLELWFL